MVYFLCFTYSGQSQRPATSNVLSQKLDVRISNGYYLHSFQIDDIPVNSLYREPISVKVWVGDSSKYYFFTWIWKLVFKFSPPLTLFQYPISFLIVRPRKVSKPRDFYLELSNRSGIWQAQWQPSCRCASKIAKRCDNLNDRSRGFETSRDVLIRRLIGYQVETMMTSSNGNIFRVTGHLCGEFTGPRWIPHTKASDAELWCLLWSTPE